MKKYNINELLEKKKELEGQIVDGVNEISCEELKFRKEEVTDYTRDKDNKHTYIKKPKVSLAEYCHEIFGYVDELSKVKKSIQKYNAEQVLGKLQERESARYKIRILEKIKENLPTDKEHSRKVTRADKEGTALETTETISEPMFEKKEVEQMKNQFASEERKINTEIQRKNLEATIQL